MAFLVVCAWLLEICQRRLPCLPPGGLRSIGRGRKLQQTTLLHEAARRRSNVSAATSSSPINTRRS